MKKIAIVTDSNSGMTQKETQGRGIYVIPMPFYINEVQYLEDISLSQEEFYHYLEEKAEISTSMPAIPDVTDLWDSLLKEYDEIVHIPMSSGLSGSCETAIMLAQNYKGRVEVVNNRRISLTMRQSVDDARLLADHDWSAAQIREYLEKVQYDSSIYITLDTLYYLKKGGRITPAAAALGTLLHLKPVLQIQGGKLDAYAKCRTLKAAKSAMLEAVKKDCIGRFQADPDYSNIRFGLAYSGINRSEIEAWKEELLLLFPGHEFMINPLSLSVSCHIGPGAVAITCNKTIPDEIWKNTEH